MEHNSTSSWYHPSPPKPTTGFEHHHLIGNGPKNNHGRVELCIERNCAAEKYPGNPDWLRTEICRMAPQIILK